MPAVITLIASWRDAERRDTNWARDGVHAAIVAGSNETRHLCSRHRSPLHGGTAGLLCSRSPRDESRSYGGSARRVRRVLAPP